MLYEEELFGNIDNVAQPQKLEPEFNNKQNKKSLFSNLSQIEDTLNDIQDQLKSVHGLYDELGEGKIDENLSIQRRNDIIEKLNEHQQNIEDLTQTMNQYILNDLVVARGLKVAKSTSTSAFDKLLNKSSNTRLTSKDLSFQRRN